MLVVEPLLGEVVGVPFLLPRRETQVRDATDSTRDHGVRQLVRDEVHEIAIARNRVTRRTDQAISRNIRGTHERVPRETHHRQGAYVALATREQRELCRRAAQVDVVLVARLVERRTLDAFEHYLGKALGPLGQGLEACKAKFCTRTSCASSTSGFKRSAM